MLHIKKHPIKAMSGLFSSLLPLSKYLHLAYVASFLSLNGAGSRAAVCSFGHDPKFQTTGEGRDIACPVELQLKYKLET